VDLQRAALHAVLGEHAVAFKHGLGDDPRFSGDVLGPLAATLPAGWIRAHEAQYDPHEPRGMCVLPADADLDIAIRELSTSASSIRLYNLERTAEFRELSARFEGVVRDLVGNDEGGMQAVNLGAFVASPAAVTPAHPDRHHNLLLQVSGRKEVWVEDDPDRRRRYLREVSYFAYPQRGAPELPPARCYVMEPGDGVYIPPYAYHWTTVLGDEPAGGLSVGFSTPVTIRSNDVHDWDVRVRRLGLRPRPAKPGSVREAAKRGLLAAAVRTAPARKQVKGRIPWYGRSRSGGQK
jgi:Cupin superfamily protein